MKGLEPIDFKIKLKAPDKKRPASFKIGLAFLVAYGKSFKGHRFLWSTGIKVKRTGFDPAIPDKALKELIKIAEQASVDIRKEGHPLTNAILEQRIELMVDRVRWNKAELSIWANDEAQAFTIPDGVEQRSLNEDLEEELTRKKPDLKKVVASHLTGDKNELFGFWQAVVDGTIKPRSGKKIRKITATNKRQTLKLVKEYKSGLTFAMTDMKFFNEFTSWMADEKQYEPNSIGKHIKELKSILHLAKKNDMPVNEKFIYWPVTREANEVVTLSKDEVLKITDLKLEGIKKDVRDIFIMACFLGLRIGDFKNLVKENFFTENGIEFFGDVQGKTGAIVKVPVFPQVQKLLRDRGDFPKMISEQNFRSNVKQICKDAELNDRVIIRIRDSKPQFKKKWEAISPHSARRTFASGLFYGWWGKPLPAALCMRYTGHKTEKSFMLYIGASAKDLDAKALEYFDLKPKMVIA